MNSVVIKFCKILWDITPFFAVRQFYLDTFMKLVRGRKITRVVEGMRFDLDLSENIEVCLFLEKFERDVVAAIEKHCQPGFLVLDIGANIGAHTLRLAKSVGSRGMVYAFEPTTYAFDKLSRNVDLNNSLPICAYRVALSNKNEINQSISFRSSWQTDGTSVSGTCAVDFVPLDEWCAHHGLTHVDLIKIDVDGNEFPVFDGARKLIAACRPIIIMEVGAWHFADSNGNVLLMLAELGYRFLDTKSRQEYFSVDEIRGVLPDEDQAMTVSMNLVAIPRSAK